MPRLFITGDTHGFGLFNRFSKSNFPEQESLSKDDVCVICGDAGILWDGNDKDRKKIEFLESLSFTVAFIDGNHENFDLLIECPGVEKFGGLVGEVSDSIFHLKRGKMYTICGYTLFTFGGALSIDKHLRIPNLTWFEEEIPSIAEQEEGIRTLESADSLDIVITHTCPKELKTEFIYDMGYIDPTERYLSHVYDYAMDINEELRWYFGHFHLDEEIDSTFTSVYEQIIEIK